MNHFLFNPRKLVVGLAVAVFVIFGALSIHGNPPDTSWTRTFGGVDVDVGAMAKCTPDGGYLLVGWTYSFGSGGSDLYLIKTNAVGTAQWSRVYGGPLNDGGDVFVVTPDSCSLIAGLTYSFGAGGSDVWIVKVNTDGDTLWTRVYGGAYNEAASGLQQTSDGNYIIAGRTYNPVCLNDIYLIKIDENGDTLWTRSFGGNGDEYCYSIIETGDRGFVVCGRGRSSGAVDFDVFLGKVDSTGNLLWLKTYGGHQDDYGYSVQHASNGGYLIAGHTTSFGAGNWDVYLIMTDSLGDTVWTRTYGGSQPDEAFCIQPVQAGFVIAGATYSFGAGLSDMYLLKVADSGDTLWTATYGGSDEDWAYHVSNTQDSAYVVIGYSESFGPGYVDVYLVKTTTDAGVQEERGYGGLGGTKCQLTCSPNPFISQVTISLVGEPEHRGTGETELNIYDITGRLVQKVSLPTASSVLPAVVRWDAKGIAPGIYFVEVNGSLNQKIIKIE